MAATPGIAFDADAPCSAFLVEALPEGWALYLDGRLIHMGYEAGPVEMIRAIVQHFRLPVRVTAADKED